MLSQPIPSWVEKCFCSAVGNAQDKSISFQDERCIIYLTFSSFYKTHEIRSQFYELSQVNVVLGMQLYPTVPMNKEAL